MVKEPEGRILTRAQLSRHAAKWRREGTRIVFTNGVFDILHRGHVELLSRAKSWGDVLVVGLNSDASTRRLKGDLRPVNPARNRAAVLAALRSVDVVCVFPEDTPLQLIKRVKPHVLVKGAQYAGSEIVGAKEVQSWGGVVKRFRMRRGLSTTSLLGRIKSKHPVVD